MSKTQTLKGFRDILPAEAKKREWLKTRMIDVFKLWGYSPIETPTLEPLEIFKDEVGEDEKLFYKFKDQGDRDVILRYDQTVPTCRFVGENFDKLTFPFKRYQIQPNFRAEKPQKGRYREFVQADIDIFGEASPLADAECIALSIDLYLRLGFKNVTILINNRDLLKEIPYPVVAAVDKIRKIGKEEVIEEIQGKGYSQEQAEKYLNDIYSLQPDEKLNAIFNYLDKLGYKENYKFDPSLMRSFSYSQGPIWEVTIPGYSTSSLGGSVGGGERYDDLVERVTGKQIPGTGIAFGFDRTLEAAEELGLIPNLSVSTKVLVTVFSEELLDQSIKTVSLLREKNIATELYPSFDKKLDKQIKYADKKEIPLTIIIGPDEAQNNTVTIKDLKNKTQETLPISEACEKLSKSSE